MQPGNSMVSMGKAGLLGHGLAGYGPSGEPLLFGRHNIYAKNKTKQLQHSLALSFSTAAVLMADFVYLSVSSVSITVNL